MLLMEKLAKSMKNIARKAMKVAITLITVISSVALLILYSNWSAEKDAQSFCHGVPLGSDITVEIMKFETKIGDKLEPGGKVSVRHYGFPEEGFPKGHHSFLFKGFMFEKAYCDVSLDENGKVVSKRSYMQYD